MAIKLDVEVENKIKNDNFNLANKQILSLKKLLYKLNLSFLKSNEKVAYYYEDLDTGLSISFNKNMTFYAASTMKTLVSIYLYENASQGEIDLDKKLMLTESNCKQGSGVLKNEPLNKEFTLRELVKYAITESDNSAYKMLMDFVGVETIKEYGHSLGATTTMVGKDHYGIINSVDAVTYLKKLLSFVKDNKELGEELFNYFKNTSLCLIDKKNLDNNTFAHKYGFFEVAYHEIGIVLDKAPYILCIMTQKGQLKNKEKFMNDSAKKINKLHQEIQKYKKSM